MQPRRLTVVLFLVVIVPASGLPRADAESFAVSAPIDGNLVRTDLARFSARAPGFRLPVPAPDGGYMDVAPPRSNVYRGAITGEPESFVVARFKPGEGLEARGENLCGAGTWGRASDGSERSAPECP
jgi:hypothetical protein